MTESDVEIALVVAGRRSEADGVVGLTLRGPSGEELPPWRPGAHLEIVLPSGVIRHYSLCGDIGVPDEYRIAVLREPASRGGSAEVHDAIDVGTTLRARGPRNHFELARAGSYLFIAGGIGITPLLPMIAQVEAAGTPWKLAYGGRTASSMAFVDEVEARTGGKVDLLPEDRVGRPDLAGLLADRPADGLVYCCGPEGLLRAVEDECSRIGATGQLHVERFTSGVSAVPDGGDPSAFEVHLARTGITVTVPQDRTILDVVRDVLPDVESSCEEGICGTCETRVLDGTPEHRDQIMSESERESAMMICVGRSRSARLVLDL